MMTNQSSDRSCNFKIEGLIKYSYLAKNHLTAHYIRDDSPSL